MRACCISVKGNERPFNEDNFIFGKQFNEYGRDCRFAYNGAMPSGWLHMGIFDGLGGMYRSELASGLAARCVLKAYGEAESISRNMLYSLLVHVHSQVLELSSRLGEDSGTTAALCSIRNGRLYAANAGDSRIYLLRSGRYAELSKEHSDRSMVEKLGLDREPELTQFLGMSETEYALEPYVCKLSVQKGDRLLLCSDGLLSKLSPAQAAAIAAEELLPELRAEKLLDAAIKAGSTDNITIILCDLDEI